MRIKDFLLIHSNLFLEFWVKTYRNCQLSSKLSFYQKLNKKAGIKRSINWNIQDISHVKVLDNIVSLLILKNIYKWDIYKN